MMKKYKDIFLKGSKICSGLAIICFIFYIRILRKRFPIDIIYLDNLPLLSISCILVIIHVYYLKSILLPGKPNKFFAKISEYIQHSYYAVFEFMYEFVEQTHSIFRMISNFVTKAWLLEIFRYVCIAMDIVIRLFISIVLVVDICIMERFSLFYKVLILLVLPIVLKVIIYISHAYGFKILNNISPEIALETLPGGQVDYILSDPNRSCVHCLAKLSKLYDLGLCTIVIFEYHEAYKSSQVIKYLSACISIHYIVGWGTIAFKIISSF